jgi:HPt (histidine-containing phosphotransfer) domain-containing protein
MLEKWLPKEEKAATHASPVFNKADMMSRLMGDDELAHQVVSAFLDDIPKQIEMLRTYLQAGDAASAERQAHTIKSAAANVSGGTLYAVAFEMERAGKAGNLQAVTARLPELESQFSLLREAMQKEFTQ